MGADQKRETPAPPKNCSALVVKFFDEGWPKNEGTFIDVQS
jgi:hypothetical protein